MASGRKSRAQRAAALGNHLGTHLSKNSLDCLVQMDNIEPHEHVAQAKKLDHPFTCPPDLPLYLQLSAEYSGTDPEGANRLRAQKWSRLQRLAGKCKPLDEEIRGIMNKSMKKAAGTMRLGLLTTLTMLLK